MAGLPSAPKIKETKTDTGAGFSSASFGGSQGGMASRRHGGMGQSRSMMGGTCGWSRGDDRHRWRRRHWGHTGRGGRGGGPLEGAGCRAGGGAQGTSPKEGVRIIPDEENNLLLVVAPPYEWNIISRILAQLDIMPRQVLNEVLIAEVRLTDDLKYGIEFLLGACLPQPKPPPAPRRPPVCPAGFWWPINKERIRLSLVQPVLPVPFPRPPPLSPA